MKKFIIFLLIFLIFISQLYYVSAAETSSEIISPQTVNIGDVFDVVLNIYFGEEAYAFQCDINFDNTALQLNNSDKNIKIVKPISGENYYTQTIQCFALKKGNYSITVDNIYYVPKSQTKENVGDCFCNIKVDDFSSADTIIYINPPNKREYLLNSQIDCLGGSVDYFMNGTLQEEYDLQENMVYGFNTLSVGTKTACVKYKGEVATFLYLVYDENNIIAGDVNSDLQITSADLVRLKKYLAGQAIPILSKSSDVNGDSEINTIDLIRLKKYFAGQNVELKSSP